MLLLEAGTKQVKFIQWQQQFCRRWYTDWFICMLWWWLWQQQWQAGGGVVIVIQIVCGKTCRIIGCKGTWHWWIWVSECSIGFRLHFKNVRHAAFFSEEFMGVIVTKANYHAEQCLKPWGRECANKDLHCRFGNQWTWMKFMLFLVYLC
jgi:hypothetical protein